MTKIRLHINIDHVATLRNARGTPYPDPVSAVRVCEASGADGITAHLREDRRHIRDEDVEAIRKVVRTKLNLEMACTHEMESIAERVCPDVITLVPERREERTTEGGLDVVSQATNILRIANMARRQSIRLSLFIAPDQDTVRRSADLGAQQVELHTGDYCEAVLRGDKVGIDHELSLLRRAALFSHSIGLEVAAGHGLTRHNLVPIAAIAELAEVNIGHAVIADAVFLGLDAAVKAYREVLDQRGGSGS